MIKELPLTYCLQNYEGEIPLMAAKHMLIAYSASSLTVRSRMITGESRPVT